MKATHGLASPLEFSLPAPHPGWGGDIYAGLDVSKAHPPQVVYSYCSELGSSAPLVHAVHFQCWNLIFGSLTLLVSRHFFLTKLYSLVSKLTA